MNLGGNVKFVKLGNYWYEYDETTPLNNARLWNTGLGCSSGIDISNNIVVEANDFTELDWHGTSVYDNCYNTGWLAPDGTFYGCDYKHHKEHAKYVQKLTEREMEERGFIKITCNRIRENPTALLSYHFVNNVPITRQQYCFLKQHPIINFDEVDYVCRIIRKRINDKQNSQTF